MEAVTFKILPEQGSGRGTAPRSGVVEGPRRRRGSPATKLPPLARRPLHHSLREWSPSPSKLGEDF